jgi:hypothetical protein
MAHPLIKQLEEDLKLLRTDLSFITDDGKYRACRREMNHKHALLTAYKKIVKWGFDPADPDAISKMAHTCGELDWTRQQLDAAWDAYRDELGNLPIPKAVPREHFDRYHSLRVKITQRDEALHVDYCYAQDIILSGK